MSAKKDKDKIQAQYESLLVDELKRVYSRDPQNGALLIEEFLTEKLSGFSQEQKLAILKNIRSFFPSHNTENGFNASQLMPLLSSFILGESLSDGEISPEELADKMISALNKLFETLNEVMSVINNVIIGQDLQLATIRQVLGKCMDGDNESLDAYLHRIKEVFLVAYEAFQKSSEVQIAKLLKELDPMQLEEELSTNLKFGALRKAALYEIYCDKFKKCEEWFNSARFKQDLLREFENKCQEILTQRGLKL